MCAVVQVRHRTQSARRALCDALACLHRLRFLGRLALHSMRCRGLENIAAWRVIACTARRHGVRVALDDSAVVRPLQCGVGRRGRGPPLLVAVCCAIFVVGAAQRLERVHAAGGEVRRPSGGSGGYHAEKGRVRIGEKLWKERRCIQRLLWLKMWQGLRFAFARTRIPHQVLLHFRLYRSVFFFIATSSFLLQPAIKK